MAKAGALTTRLAPSSLPNCSSLFPFALEKLKQDWGCCVPFPWFDTDSAPRFVSWCGLAVRPQGCRNRDQLGSELGDFQAQETGSSSSSSPPPHAILLRETTGRAGHGAGGSAAVPCVEAALILHMVSGTSVPTTIGFSP